MNPESHYRSSLAVVILCVTGVIILCWLFPLFHIIPLERATKERAAAVFNAEAFAEKFWNDQLLKSLDRSVKTDALLPAIQTDAAAARKQFARSLGVSESYTYFVSGSGQVLAVNEDAILLGVSVGATNAEVALETGLLFSNAVRDGTGLLNVNDYPNSQDFNAISEALNHLVETRVQPGLRAQAKVGATVRFVGCAEVNDESTDLKPLKIVPLSISVE